MANHEDLLVDEALCPWCHQPLGGGHEEFRAIQARMAQEEAERSARREQQMRDQFARDTAKLESQAKAAITKAGRDATKAAEAKLKAVRANQDTVVAAAVTAERERSEKAVADAVTAVKIEHAGETARLESLLADATRRLQARTPHQLGEPLEVALFEAVSGACSAESGLYPPGHLKVSRVPKGRNGPDLIVEIFDPTATETPIGCVVVDAKNHSRWSSSFIRKLKADARGLNAEAILATNTFPKEGEGGLSVRGLGVIDGVIISDPRYVVPLIEMLRKQIVEMHRQKLTQKARNQKGAALLDFVGSSRCAELLRVFTTIQDRLRDTDQKEQAAHAGVWKRRAELIRSLQVAHHDLISGFDAILGGRLEPLEGSPAKREAAI